MEHLSKDQIIELAGLDQRPEDMLSRYYADTQPRSVLWARKWLCYQKIKCEDRIGLLVLLIFLIALSVICGIVTSKVDGFLLKGFLWVLASFFLYVAIGVVSAFVNRERPGSFVLGPIHLPMGLFAAWKVYWFEKRAKVSKTPAGYVINTYKYGLDRVKELFIGEKSELMRTTAEIQKRLAVLHHQYARIYQRTVEGVDDMRSEVFTELGLSVHARITHYQTALQNHERIATNAQQFFQECHAGIDQLAPSVDDLALILEVKEGEAYDARLLARSQKIVREFADHLGDAVIRLHSAIGSVVLPAEVESVELSDYIHQLEDVAGRVAELQLAAAHDPAIHIQRLDA